MRIVVRPAWPRYPGSRISTKCGDSSCAASRRNGRLIHAAIKRRRILPPGESSGVIGIPRVGVRLALGIEFDFHLDHAAAPGDAGRLLETGQELAATIDQPSADQDLAHDRVRRPARGSHRPP